MSLQHREDLLHELASNLEERHRNDQDELDNWGQIGGRPRLDLTCVYVELLDQDGDVLVDLPYAVALSYVVGDVYYNEEHDWSEAKSVRFRTI